MTCQPPHNPQARGPSLVICPQLLIQYIWRSIHNLRVQHAVMTRIPLNVYYISLSKLSATGTGTFHEAKITSPYERQPRSERTEGAYCIPRQNWPKGISSFHIWYNLHSIKCNIRINHQLVKYKNTHCFTLSGMLACSSGTTSANSAKVSTKFSLRLNLELYKQNRK